jgi:Na+/melibiose symporter-like transporter
MTANTLNRRTVSRISYYALSALNYIAIQLLADVFLVDLLQYAGFHDGAIGIITSANGIVAFVQILLVFVGHKIRKQKPLIFLGFTGMSFMFFLSYVVALCPMEALLKQILILACSFLGRLVVNFASPFLSIYKYSFVSYQERGTVDATNSTISLATAIIFTLTISAVRDYYRESGNVDQGLQITAIFLGIVTLLTALSIVMMRGSSEKAADSKPVTGIKDVLQHTLGSKSFLCMLLFYIFWLVASTITTNFLGIYKVNELGFSLGATQIISTAGSITAMLLARPMGKLADKKSHSLCLKYALMAHIVAFLVSAFTAPETAWLTIVYAIISGIAGLVLSSCYYNLLLEYIGPTYYIAGISLITCISNALGFAVSFFAAWLLETIQSMGNTLFGMKIYAQQILSAISAVMTLGLLGYAHFILTRLPKRELIDTKDE